MDVIRKVKRALLNERIIQHVDKIKYLRKGIRDAELSNLLPSNMYTKHECNDWEIM